VSLCGVVPRPAKPSAGPTWPAPVPTA
jgi:hypothetical protein